MSVYDLGEEEQLTLAIQRSLSDDTDPELTTNDAGGNRPSTAPRPGSPSSSTAGPSSFSSASLAHRGSVPELTGGDSSGGLVLPQQPAVEPELSLPSPDGGPSSSTYTAANPERVGGWASSVADEACGGGGVARPVAPSPISRTSSQSAPSETFGGGPGAHASFGAGPAAAVAAGPSGAAPSGAAVGADSESSAVDAEVRRALDCARNKMFDEAEAILAALCADRPDQRQSREVQAAWEAVAMCKHFHAAKT